MLYVHYCYIRVHYCLFFFLFFFLIIFGLFFFFFFQAEDGIRDVAVTGVQTCALPIYSTNFKMKPEIQKLHNVWENNRAVQDTSFPQISFDDLTNSIISTGPFYYYIDRKSVV